MKEIWDRIEADYIEESQYQIPNPELGPLERRVGLTYEDALFSEDISVKDTEYWFSEPEGANLCTCSAFTGQRELHPLGCTERPGPASVLHVKLGDQPVVMVCTGGWNQEPKRIPKAEVVPNEWATPEHFGDGRVRLCTLHHKGWANSAASTPVVTHDRLPQSAEWLVRARMR